MKKKRESVVSEVASELMFQSELGAGEVLDPVTVMRKWRKKLATEKNS